MKKQILIFGHGYNNPFVDVNNQYAHCFDQNKYDVTIMYLSGKSCEVIRKQHSVKEVIFLNAENKRGLKLALIKKLKKICTGKQFDIVICHRYKPSYLILWTSLFCNIPNVFFVMHELGTFNHFFRKLTARCLFRTNMRFAGVSTAVQQDLKRHLPSLQNKIIKLPNMIDVEETHSKLFERKSARQKLRLPPDAFIFGNIGRLVENKDQRNLINAFALIKDHCPNALLVIVGTGRLENQLIQLINELNLKNCVILTGFIAEGFRYMKAFDTYVSSSIQEAFGRVLLEAMVAEIPIIATAVNGVPEVMDTTGKLVPPFNTKLLADEMLACYQSSPNQLHALGSQGGSRVRTEFSIPRFKEIFWQEVGS